MKRVIVILLLVAAGVAAWKFWPPPPPFWPLPFMQSAKTDAATADRPRRGSRRGGPGANETTPVVAIDAKAEDVPVYLEGVGTFQAPNTVTVRPQVEGTLIEVDFKEGQDVKAGDVLAKIDPATYQAQYDQSVAQKGQFEAQLANARTDLERYTRLAKNDYGSQQQAATAASTVKQLEAQVRYYGALIDQAKTMLDRTEVKAPIAGRTGVRGVDQGNYVTAGQTTGIVTITQLQPIAAVFTLPQQDIPAVTAAMARGPVKIDALAADGTTALDSGTLEVLDNQVDQQTGTVRLKGNFPNDKLSLWPGQFTNVRVAVDVLKDVVTVPGPAVQQGPDGPFVFLVKDDQTVSQQKVEIKRQDAELAVIQSGLKAGEKVVTTGFTRLRDGAKVAVNAAGANATGPETEAPSSDAEQKPNGQRRRHNGGAGGSGQ